MADSEVECLSEVFRCFICMQQLQNARLCPHCSKLCCAPCIERWLMEQRQHCPHCREPLQKEELVKCRWAEEVTQQIDSMRSMQLDNKTGRLDKDRCEQHSGEKLSVFCVSCKMCICHLCALFVNQHSGHAFKPLEEEYEIHKKKITDEISALRRRLVELDGLKRDIDKNMETVKYAKGEREAEMRTVVNYMAEKLESQLKAKLSKLKGQKNSICNETEFLEKILEEVEKELKQKSKSEIIACVDHLMGMFSKVHETPMSNFVSAPVPADFVSEIVPQYQSSTFTLHNFSELRHKADPVYSPNMSCNGIKWRLKVYPDGNGVARSTYLSVFLELVEGVQETSKYEYKVEMLQHRAVPIRNIVREFASDFEVGECWGYNRFFRLDMLEDEGYLHPHDDYVVLKFHVRPPTFFQKCRDQAWYIQQLEEVHSQHVEQLHNLKLSIREKTLSEERAVSGGCHVPARDLSTCNSASRNNNDGTENSIEADESSLVRNIDEEYEEAACSLPCQHENVSIATSNPSILGSEGEEDDSTLQKIRESICEIEDTNRRPLSADSWERRLMNQIGASCLPGTSDNNLNNSHPNSELGSSIQSVTTDELEPELVGLMESESETELPTLNNFTPDLLGEVSTNEVEISFPHPKTFKIQQSTDSTVNSSFGLPESSDISDNINIAYVNREEVDNFDDLGVISPIPHT